MSKPISLSRCTSGVAIPTEADLIRKDMLLEFLSSLHLLEIPYVMLSGYDTYPNHIPSDIDFMVSEENLTRLPLMFLHGKLIGSSSLLQLITHESGAYYFIMSRQDPTGLPVYLHPDASSSYRRNGRLWLRSDVVLAARVRRHDGMWIPAPAIEFEYYYIKRVDKNSLDADHLFRLGKFLAQDPDGCREALQRLAGDLAAEAEENIRSADIDRFRHKLPQLRKRLRRSAPVEPLLSRLKAASREVERIARRIIRPTGLVIAVLGADGSGKSTLIEALEEALLPAFRATKRYHLRPRFGKAPSGVAAQDPHGQSARSWIMSLLKLGLFLADYWWGWIRYIYPLKIRSHLIIFDRYLHDFLIDPHRYRMKPDFRIRQWAAYLAPKPDLWLVLDAPAEQLVARKGETTLAVAQVLTGRYRAFASETKGAILIDTDRPLALSVSQASAHVSAFLTDRIRGRLSGARL